MRTILLIIISASLLLARSADYPFTLLPRYDIFSTYDPLYTTFETKFFRRAKKSITFKVGLDYSWGYKWFDQEGTKIESTFVYGMNRDKARFGTADYTSYTFSGDLMYCPTEAWKIGAIVTLVYRTVSPQDAYDVSSFGIGDTWFYATALMMPDPSVLVRIAAKAPTGKWKDYFRAHDWQNQEEVNREADLPTGDGQWDIDFGILSSFPLQHHKSGIDPLTLDVTAGIRLRSRQNFSDYTWSNTWTDTLEAYSGRDSIVTYRIKETLQDIRPGNELHFNIGPRALLSPKIWGSLKLAGFLGFNTRINGIRKYQRLENGDWVDVQEEERYKNLDLDGRKAIYIVPGAQLEIGVGLQLYLRGKYPIFRGKNYPVDTQIIGVVMSRKFGPSPTARKKW